MVSQKTYTVHILNTITWAQINDEIESKTIPIIEAISFRKIKTHVTKTKITTKNIKFQNLRFIFLFINKNLQINKRKFLDAQKLTTINLQFFQKFLNNNAK